MRHALALVALLALPPAISAGGGGPAPRGTAGADLPITGLAVPGMASFDRIMTGLLAKWPVPGAAVAVVQDGRLVFARGYGWADREQRQPVEPDSLFRIASLSKSLTAAAILKLEEEGRLKLDDRAFQILRDLKPRPGAKINPQLAQITLRQLLQHTGGWDRDQSFDPMFRSREIAQTMGVPSPADATTIVRYMLDQPLQSAPGTHYAYSNFGYCVLGRVIEKVTGERYEDFVKTQILRPAGITCLRLGHTLENERAPREVRYYSFPGAGLGPSVFPGGPARLPWPYGAWSIEAMDSHGGWIASAVDLARFIDGLEGRGGVARILRPASLQQMLAPPAPPIPAAPDTWYGMGWQVRPANGDANWWHAGSLDGTTTLMVRAANGLTWVVLFNSRPKSDKFGGEVDSALWRAVDGVKQWPTHDLFAKFGGCPAGR